MVENRVEGRVCWQKWHVHFKDLEVLQGKEIVLWLKDPPPEDILNLPKHVKYVKLRMRLRHVESGLFAAGCSARLAGYIPIGAIQERLYLIERGLWPDH